MPPAASKKGEKKAGKAATAAGDPKCEKKRKESYSIYIYKVLKQVHPDTGISSKAMLIMNLVVNDVFERIAVESYKLAKYYTKATISSREIQTAVRLLLHPGGRELAKFAVSEGTKAITKYTSSPPAPDPVTFAQALFKQQLEQRRRLPDRAVPGVIHTLAGDTFTTPAFAVNCAATVAGLQRRAWTAGACAMEAEPDEVYFVNPEDPVALYRPCITVKVSQAVEGEPAAAAVEVQLATERGPLDGETEPTNVHYALKKICKTIGLEAVDDKALRGYRLVVPEAHASSVLDDLQRPLYSVGIVDGSELQLVGAARDAAEPSPSAADVTRHRRCLQCCLQWLRRRDDGQGDDQQQGDDVGQGADQAADTTTAETPPLVVEAADTAPVAARLFWRESMPVTRRDPVEQSGSWICICLRLRLRRLLGRARRAPAWCFRSAASTATSGATAPASAAAPQSTSPPSLSTSPPKSSSLPATPPATTRTRGSARATSSSPSATTRSSTSSWATSPSSRAVVSRTSTPSFSLRNPESKRLKKDYRRVPNQLAFGVFFKSSKSLMLNVLGPQETRLALISVKLRKKGACTPPNRPVDKKH